MTQVPDDMHVVIALKGNGEGKGRLASVLNPEMRQRLIATMFEQVVSVAVATVGIGRVSVLSREAGPISNGCGQIDDPGLGLNAAITQAATLLRRAGRCSMLVLPADLPFMTEADLRALVEVASERSVVIGPDASGTGTNALLVPLPSDLHPSFGAHSFSAHCVAAAGAGLETRIVNRPGIACDIDEPADLDILIRTGGVRYSFLAHALRKAS